MTMPRTTAARDVVAGQKILMNGNPWKVTDVTHGSVRTVIYATYGGALLTLRTPPDLTVSVVEEFYPGKPLTFWGQSWRVQRSDSSRIWLSSGPGIELVMSLDALREEMS